MKASLIKAITDSIEHIRTHHPELYKYLDEANLNVPDLNDPEVDNEVLKQYLEGLRDFERKYNVAHHINK